MKILLLCLFYGIAHAAEWSYAGEKGVEYWPSRPDTMCNKESQSPIDIPKHGDLVYTEFDPWVLTGYDNMQTAGMKIKNNGHTAQIDIAPTDLGNTKVSGGGLNGTYIALQLHFHWGRNDHEGSEHTFRGQKYPLEMHIVHFKEAYGTVSDAVKYPDGLAVLGFFFATADAEDNSNLAPLIDGLANVDFKDENAPIAVDFADLMPSEKSYFYRYKGSLTTPECNEVVVWTVFDHPNTISSAQMSKFRQLYEYKENEERHHITWNYRPTQPLFGRKVHKNYQQAVPSSWHWGYEGAEGAPYWKSYYETCSGNQQSPINLPPVDSLAPFDPSMKLDKLEFRNYDKPITGTIKNNGHTVQIDIDNSDIHLTKGGLDGNYIAAQFHFHWGHDGHEGSEHTLEGKAYPLEMHIVHYKEEYKDLAGAIPKADGLAVVGLFFETGGALQNRHYENIVTHLPDVKYKGSNKAISGFNLKQLISDNLRLNETTGLHMPFYRYMGGLTTPPCSEIVTWTVLKYPIYISQAQMEAFREVTHISSGPVGSHDYIKKNFRPTQNLAGRQVYQSGNFADLVTDGASGLLPSMISMAAILVMAVIL